MAAIDQRWHWSNISGATYIGYTIASVDTSMNGYQYHAVFTNSVASDTTNAATPTVTAGPATVTSLSAVVSRGNITVTFIGAGDPSPTTYQCRMDVNKNPTWVSCVSGDLFKSSAKTVSVRAYNPAGSGVMNTVAVTRARK